MSKFGRDAFEKHYRPLPYIPPLDWRLEARKFLYPEVYSQYGSSEIGKKTPSSCDSATMSKSFLSMSSWSDASAHSSCYYLSSSPYLKNTSGDAAYLPSELEHTIKLKKRSKRLGLTVDVTDSCINGCLVKELSVGGIFDIDGRVKVGDYLTNINHENLRHSTYAKVRAILKRAELIGAEVTFFSVTYVSRVEADDYLERLKNKFAHDVQPQVNLAGLNQLSPRIHPRWCRVGEEEKMELSKTKSVVSSNGYESNPNYCSSTSTTTSPTLNNIVSDTLAPQSMTPPFEDSAEPIKEAKAQNRSPFEYPKTELNETNGNKATSLSRSEHVDEADTSHEGLTNGIDHGHNVDNDDGSGCDRLMRNELAHSAVASVSIGERIETVNEEEANKWGRSVVEVVSVASPSLATVASSSSTVDANRRISSDVVECTSTPSRRDSSDSRSTTAAMINGGGGAEQRSTSSSAGKPKYWGNPREVELIREPDMSLGISIVGGTVETRKSDMQPSIGGAGVFVKNIAFNSPAALCGKINVGDRIVSVNDFDLKSASHETAVKIIKNAQNPIRIVVQSLHYIPEGTIPSANDPISRVAFIHDRFERKFASCTTISDTFDDVELAFNYPSVNYQDVEFETIEGNEIVTPLEESQARPVWNVSPNRLLDYHSAAALLRLDDDTEVEDYYGYTQMKVDRKYSHLEGQLLLVELEKRPNGLGFSLAGNRNRSKQSVFVVGVHPDSQANDKIGIGDELIEVISLDTASRLDVTISNFKANGIVILGRSHITASAMIKTLPGPLMKFVIRRFPGSLFELAVPPIDYETKISETPMELTASLYNLDRRATVCVGNLLMNRESSPVPSTPKASNPRKVKIRKGPNGFGLTLTKGVTSDGIGGFFITNLSPDSPVYQEKSVRIGDQVIALNGNVITDETSSQFVNLVQSTDEILELTLCSHSAVPLPIVVSSPRPVSKTPNPCSTDLNAKRKQSIAPTVNLSTNPIVSQTDTLIEIDRTGLGLGLSIVGGADTILGTVLIHEMYPDGAAAKDGRLEPWDQILQVNGQSLENVTHEKAISILRQTPTKVRLLIYRDPSLHLNMLDPDHIYNIFHIDLVKKQGKGLGLSIVGRKNEVGVFVSEVVKNGVADVDGRLTRGDQILAVNGQDLTNATHEQAATILKTCMGKVSMKIGRWKFLDNLSASSTKIDGNEPLKMNHSVSLNDKMSKLTSAEDRKHSEPITTKTTATVKFEDAVTPLVTFHQEESSIPKPILAKASICESSEMNMHKISSVSYNENTSSSNGSVTPTSSSVVTVREIEVLHAPPASDRPHNQRISASENELPCDIVIVEITKIAGHPLGMGVGKRSRGILVTSVQPDTPVADKLKVGDRILEVNHQKVIDQPSAVSYIKNSGPHLILKLARPKPEIVFHSIPKI